MELNVFNIVGFIGTILYILSYLLLQYSIIYQGKAYVLMNLIAAICVSISLLYYWNAPSFTIQIVWIVISLIGFYRLIRKESEVDEIHLILDYNDMSTPKYILKLKGNNFVSIYTCDDKVFWSKLKDKRMINIRQGNLFSRNISIPKYDTPMPFKDNTDYYYDSIEILNKKGVVVFQITQWKIKKLFKKLFFIV